MKRRNSPQKKEQEETTARDLTNTDTSKMSEPEFRTMIIRILAGVEKKHRIPFRGDKRSKI